MATTEEVNLANQAVSLVQSLYRDIPENMDRLRLLSDTDVRPVSEVASDLVGLPALYSDLMGKLDACLDGGAKEAKLGTGLLVIGVTLVDLKAEIQQLKDAWASIPKTLPQTKTELAAVTDLVKSLVPTQDRLW